jgi:hypothetical protein
LQLQLPSWPKPEVWVPKGLLAAWFPGAPLPLDVSLQLEVDGHPWGPRFNSRVYESHQVKGSRMYTAYRATKGLGRCSELAGCRVTAFRRAAGPAAVDLIVSSLQEQQEDGGGDCKGPQRLRRPVEPEDLQPDFWPVVRDVPTLGRNGSNIPCRWFSSIMCKCRRAEGSG